MNYLNYTSEEMFSSTQLIRNSKTIFDKLQKNKDIQKAIILRDGKPSFILLDFHFYEKLMREHIDLLKSSNLKHKDIPSEDKQNFVQNIPEKPTTANIEDKTIQDTKIKQEPKIEEKEESQTSNQINENDLEKALAEIEQLDFKKFKDNKEDNPKPLKEFWDK